MGRDTSLCFGILGPLTVSLNGDPLRLETPKQRLVLARLLVAGAPVDEDALIDALWGARPPRTALTSLRSHVSRLRSTLGNEANMLAHGPGGYRLGQRWVDADAFEELVTAAQAARDESDEAAAAALLDEALALWRGPALADFRFEPFAQPSIARLEAIRLQAQEDRLEIELRLGRAKRAVPQLEQLAAQHPLRERIHELLMLSLYSCGRQADALSAYRTARATLVEELGLEPSPRLQALERDILDHAPRLLPTSTAGRVDSVDVPTPRASMLDEMDLPPLHEHVRCDLLLSRGAGLRRAGQVDASRHAYAAAARLAAAIGSGEQLAAAALGLAGPPEDSLQGSAPLDEALIEEAIRRLPGDLPVVTRLRARLAIAFIDRSEHRRGEELLAAAVATARALDDAEGLAYALRARHRTWFDPAALAERLATVKELRVLGERLGDAEILAWAHRWRAIDLLEAGALDDVDDALAALEAVGDTGDAAFHRWGVIVRRAGCAILRQPLQKAEAAVMEALALTREVRSEYTEFAALCLLAVCRWLQGRPVEAASSLPTQDLPGLVTLGVFLQAESGDLQGAAQAFGQLADAAFADLRADDPIQVSHLLRLGLLAETAATLRDTERARVLYRQLTPFTGRLVVAPPGITAMTTVDHCLGRLAAVLGEHEQAIAHFESAVAGTNHMGAVTLLPRTQLAYAQLLRGLTDRAREAEALEDAALRRSAELGLGHPAHLLPDIARGR